MLIIRELGRNGPEVLLSGLSRSAARAEKSRPADRTSEQGAAMAWSYDR